MRAAAFALALALTAGPALALDPGTASGRFAGDAGQVEFHHSVALSQDNAEGLLDNGAQIRVVLSAEEVDSAGLYGIAFPAVMDQARAASVHGVMLEFSPKAPTELHAVVLLKPADPRATLTSISLSNSAGVFKRLDVSATQVSGDYEGDGLSFSFSAPIASDAVQADLKGPAAQASEPMKVLVARAEAIGRGDLAGALALSAKSSRLREIPPDQFKQAAPMGRELAAELKKVTRVVIREHTAAAIGPGKSWQSLVRENGAWKVAD